MNNLSKKFLDFFKYKPEDSYDFTIQTSIPNVPFESETIDNSQKISDIKKIFPSIDVNLEYIKSKFNSLINSDIVIREFTLTAKDKQYSSFIIYIDGMVDSQLINDFVLNPLMLRNRANTYTDKTSRIISEAKANNITVRKVKKFDLTENIYNSLMPQNNVEKIYEFEKIISDINSGNCALFVDTINIVFDIDVKGFKQRSINPPNNEIVIKGPQEAFVENIRTNTSLLRRIVNNENLIIESTNIGKFSKTKCSICYIKNIANNDLIAEVKYRLNNLEIDYLLSSGQLEQLIEDNSSYSIPQVLSTERPDKATKHLYEGRVVVLINGNPYCLILPAIFVDFISSPEDTNIKPQFANSLRFLRILSLLITLLLPGLWLSVTNFHQELIPTELLFSILASRENVPFPVIVEILIMEFSFELIREAGLRIPSAIGPTIGIVGALILGEAAVSANIVSPILIIVIALTGIASFAIPDFAFGFHLRLLRFLFIILAYLAGFLGIGLGLFIYSVILFDLKSFGVSYMSSFIPNSSPNVKGIFIPYAFKRERRPYFLNTKRPFSQNSISMQWKYKNNK